MSPAERKELHAAIDAELAAMVADGTLVVDGDRYRLGEAARVEKRLLTRNQRLAIVELARPSCGRCGIPRTAYEGHWCADETWRGWES
jgi:hypothetical protein